MTATAHWIGLAIFIAVCFGVDGVPDTNRAGVF